MLAPAMPALGGNGLCMRLGLFFLSLARVADVNLIVAPLFGPVQDDAIRWANGKGARVHVLDMSQALDTHFGLVMRVLDPAARTDAFAHFGKPSLAARTSPKAIDQIPSDVRRQSYDIIHVSRSYLAPLALEFARKTPRPVLTLDLDEDDARVFYGLAGLAARRGYIIKQRWQTLEGQSFRRLIDATTPEFDHVWVSSSIDAGRLRKRYQSNIRVLPNAVASGPPLRRQDDDRTLLFVGTLGYEPNQDAAEWLLRDIWPALNHRSDLKLHIVGQGAPERLRNLARQRGVRMLGWVEDLPRCLASATMLVAPLRVGAGTRIKLLESAMRGVPIVTTPLGAEGHGFSGRHHIWLAECGDALATTIAGALLNRKERQRRANLARSYVTTKFGLQRHVTSLSGQFLDAV
ncbi:MAG: glycosyltransferase [Xanthobacteraceae bacterium]|nr:glycosyltransferase [Xanthobacteraceae bacterium]